MAFLVAIVALSVAGSVREGMEVPVDTRLYVQQRALEVEKDVAEAIKPIAQRTAEVGGEAAGLARQYATLTESVQQSHTSVRDLRAEVAGLRAQVEAAGRAGADVSALAARVDGLDAQLARLSGQQEAHRRAALDAISAAALDISGRTNEELARSEERVAALVDDRVREHNEAIRLLPFDVADAVRVVSAADPRSFIVLDATHGRTAVVSRSKDVPFAIGQLASASDPSAEVDVIVDGRTNMYHAIGFGPDQSAFAGLRRADDSLVLGSARAITHVSGTHVFAEPAPNGGPSMAALGDADPGFRPIVSLDSGGVHLRHHDIVSRPDGLDVCFGKAPMRRCVRVVDGGGS